MAQRIEADPSLAIGRIVAAAPRDPAMRGFVQGDGQDDGNRDDREYLQIT
jgi:hypothetical protein